MPDTFQPGDQITFKIGRMYAIQLNADKNELLSFHGYEIVQHTRPGEATPQKHGMNCPALIDNDCTCGLEFRILLQTEQTMNAAWRKRAHEAEAALAVARADLPGEGRGPNIHHPTVADIPHIKAMMSKALPGEGMKSAEEMEEAWLTFALGYSLPGNDLNSHRYAFENGWRSADDRRGGPEPRPLKEVRQECEVAWVYTGEWEICFIGHDNSIRFAGAIHYENAVPYDANSAVPIPKPADIK